MNRFRQELRVIPRAAWVVAALLYLATTTPLFFIVLPGDPDMGKWPIPGRFLFVYGIFLILPALVLLVGYVNGDAKRRGMRYVMWTLLAIFIPDCIGIILYFILRDPLPRPCPRCATLLKSGFVFCPHCGSPLQPTCPHCGHAVESAWTHCPHCGTTLPAGPQPAAPGGTVAPR